MNTTPVRTAVDWLVYPLLLGLAALLVAFAPAIVALVLLAVALAVAQEVRAGGRDG